MGIERILWVVLAIAAWLLVCLLCWRDRWAKSTADAREMDGCSDSVLVAWASQSGTAEQLARHSAAALQPHFPVRLLPLSAVDESVLRNTRRALFVASTYGEGEPPDNGLAFQRRYLNGEPALDLSHLEFAVLALGDRAYQRFCAFGRSLHVGLERLGAIPLSEPTETDCHVLDASDSLPEGWRGQITRLLPPASTLQAHASAVDIPKINVRHSFDEHWRMAARKILNPGSPGAPLYHLRLAPVDDMPQWRAGDILEVQPCNSAEQCASWLALSGLDGSRPVTLAEGTRPLLTWLSERQLPKVEEEALRAEIEADLERWLASVPRLPRREYSVASVPQEGGVQLLVRLQRDEHGELGIGSGWLSQYAELDDIIATRLRSNPGFHGPDSKQPMILIGAGSGLAGLRAHLVERAQSRRSGPNWLLFGERSRRFDRILNHELQQWLDSGHLSRLDRVFSRGASPAISEPRYVQDLLLKHRDDLGLWVKNGAAIYVCGNLTGMGTAVHDALESILGLEALEQLREAGRYRRDLY